MDGFCSLQSREEEEVIYVYKVRTYPSNPPRARRPLDQAQRRPTGGGLSTFPKCPTTHA